MLVMPLSVAVVAAVVDSVTVMICARLVGSMAHLGLDGQACGVRMVDVVVGH